VIRYQISRDAMERLINAVIPSWLARASNRTNQFIAAGEYGETSSIWGEVKTIYMDLQHNKCAYCERVLEDKEYGKIEHDMEHYRPKSSVQSWPTAQMYSTGTNRYDFATGVARPKGYFWLAYDLLNLATACKSCNSSLKNSYFPIAGDRAPDLADAQALAGEMPFLIYPISDIDDDPESIITFEGIIPVPRNNDDYRRERARVTIDFFRLDSREHLRRERARHIVAIYMALGTCDRDEIEQADKDLANQFLANSISSDAPHSSCAKTFRNIYIQDPLRAQELARLASGYLTKKSI
jgi:hypothetical protein